MTFVEKGVNLGQPRGVCVGGSASSGHYCVGDETDGTFLFLGTHWLKSLAGILQSISMP